MYGTLRRLYSAGALTSYVVPSDGGPHRKYYGINAQGRRMLAEQRDSWTAFSATMSGLLAGKPAPTSRTSRTAPATTPAPVRSIGEK